MLHFSAGPQSAKFIDAAVHGQQPDPQTPSGSTDYVELLYRQECMMDIDRQVSPVLQNPDMIYILNF